MQELGKASAEERLVQTLGNLKNAVEDIKGHRFFENF